MSADRTGAGSVALSTVTGVVVYTFGYLVTHLWQAVSVRDSLRTYNFFVDLFGGNAIPTWKAVGWLFYNAHFVPFTHPQDDARASENLIASGEAPALLYLLPPLLLLAAGFVLACVANARSADTGLRAGVGVVAGYVLLAVVGLFVFQHGSGGDAIHPHYALGTLVAGLVYPVAFGGLGGVLGAATTSR